MTPNRTRTPPTPLEKIVGFPVSEEIYDLLEISEQVILDLKIEGVTEQNIAEILGISQSTVNVIFRRVRMKLANTKLRLILETRQYYRESNPIVSEVET